MSFLQLKKTHIYYNHTNGDNIRSTINKATNWIVISTKFILESTKIMMKTIMPIDPIMNR